MRVQVFWGNEHVATATLENKEIRVEGEASDFVLSLFNPDNQSPEEFLRSLPSRLRGRSNAKLIE
jgi:hypothetical protein